MAPALPVTITPLFAPRANAEMPRSISPASRVSRGVQLHANRARNGLDGTELGRPATFPESRRTNTRVTPGAISLSSSSHFAAMPYRVGKAGGIAARVRQAVDEAGTDRVGDDGEHDRNGARRLQQRRHGPRLTVPRMTSGETATSPRVSAQIMGVGSGQNGNRSGHFRPTTPSSLPGDPANAARRACDSGSSAGDRQQAHRCAASARAAAREQRTATSAANKSRRFIPITRRQAGRFIELKRKRCPGLRCF